MIDPTKLQEQYRQAVRTCAGLTTVPFLLAFVAYSMAVGPEGIEPASNSLMLAVYGVIALSPIVTVPIFRQVARKAITTASETEAGAEAAMTTWAITEYASCEISSLMGFVGFVLTGSVPYLAACVVVTLIGYAITFPRWSRWLTILEELGLRMSVSPA